MRRPGKLVDRTNAFQFPTAVNQRPRVAGESLGAAGNADVSLALALALQAAASGRTLLGVHARWGAFRDSAPPRCFAIARPLLDGPVTLVTAVEASSKP